MPPPAAKGTTIRIGFAGQGRDSACAVDIKVAADKTATNNKRGNFMSGQGLVKTALQCTIGWTIVHIDHHQA